MNKSSNFVGQHIFSQILSLSSKDSLSKVFRSTSANKWYKSIKAWDHYVTMMFANSTTVTLSNNPFLLLSGEPGAGKSHLLADVVARAVDGITGGNISVANAYLADISTKEYRKNNFGKMSAAANIGFIAGPALAGVLGATKLGISRPIIAAIFVSSMSLGTIAFGLKDVRPQTSVREAKPEKTTFLAILKLPYISYFLVQYFLIYLGFNFFFVAFPVYAIRQLNWNVLELGIFIAILGGAMVIVQGPVLSKLSSRISGSALVIAGMLLLAVGFALFRSSSVFVLYTGLLFYALGNGISWPSFLALLANASDDKYQGVIQGSASSAGSLASIIGLVGGALLYKAIGPATFWVAAALMVLIAISSYWLVGIEKKTN